MSSYFLTRNTVAPTLFDVLCIVVVLLGVLINGIENSNTDRSNMFEEELIL